MNSIFKKLMGCMCFAVLLFTSTGAFSETQRQCKAKAEAKFYDCRIRALTLYNRDFHRCGRSDYSCIRIARLFRDSRISSCLNARQLDLSRCVRL